MKNLPLLIGSLLITVVAVFGVAFLFSNKAAVAAAPVDEKILLSDTTHVKGDKNAKVRLVEFSDFQCPACGLAQPTVDQILNLYGNKILFVYRQFPLRSVHVNAAAAAQAAEAATKQSKFWEFHDKLFASQDDWSGEKDPNPKFIAYAKDLGLNTDQFTKDLADTSLSIRITSDEKDGYLIGVNATPTFYVNGVKTDLSSVSDTINKILAANK